MDSNSLFNNLMNYSSDANKPKVENTKLKKSDMLLKNIESQGFNMSQLEDVIRTKGNQLIISIAGSGKTTALIFKIAYDIVTGEATRVAEVNGNSIRVLDKIWVCTFLKSGADELKAKLALWQRRLGLMDTSESMAFSTLHAEFKRALTAMGVSTNIIDASVNSKNLKKVLENYAITYEGKSVNSDMLRNLESALTYTRNRLDEKRYSCEVYEELDLGPTVIDTILRDWKNMRKELGCVDFEDLQELLYEEAVVKGNLEVINVLKNRYNYIYIDEFQDTSQIQYEILKVYASGVKKIVAIGDDDQTIYSWRGSYNKIITEQFSRDFNPALSKLSVNYRCPSNFVNAIKPSLELNTGRFKKELKSYNEGGRLRVGAYASYKSMADSLSEMILDDVKSGRSVAILCRVNSDGLLPALMLDKMGKFQFTISGDGMTLDSYIGRQVISIAKLFTEKATQAVRGVLAQLTWNSYSITNIMKVCKNNKVAFWDIPDNDITYSCPDIAGTLLKWKGWKKSLGEIETLKMIYMYYITNVYVKDSQYNDVCKSVISAVLAMLEITNATTVEDFLYELEETNERLKARKKKFNGSNVRIATIHEYKGKEADSVYVWNDSEDVFPHKNCDMTDIEEMEEERRVHYIACTRARKINTIMYMKGRMGQFVREMDLSKAETVVASVGGSVEELGGKVENTKVLEDEDYFDFSNLGSGKGIDFQSKMQGNDSHLQTTVDKEDIKIILELFDSGLDAHRILFELKMDGCDLYDLEQIEDVIRQYGKGYLRY